jgi:FAD/FMN-containing dehydrogenase
MSHNKNLATELKAVIEGDVQVDRASKAFYSHDAGLFEIVPSAVVFPRDSEDVKSLVRYVNKHKHANPDLSLTGRSGGTDMSGGAVNDSIIVAFEKYFKQVGPVTDGDIITAQPGAYYRDFEKVTLANNMLMPTYPASRELCMIGGMVANDAGGEKSLQHGKTHNYVQELRVVFSDGNEYTVKPLNYEQLQQKINQNDFEGNIYKQIFELVKENQELITGSKPKVSKNSSGYNLWDVWDGTTFDLTKLIVGSQGTLGMVTEATFRLIPAKPMSGMLVAFLPNLNKLGEIINAILPLKPASLESFDEHTLKFAIRFFLSFRKTLGWRRFVLLGLSLIPLLNKLLRYMPHFPKLIVLIGFEGEEQADIDANIQLAKEKLKPFDIETHVAEDKKHEEKFWTLRRESFNLLRRNVKRKHTAPFIDDLIVPPACLPEFLPKLTEILERNKLMYTVAGHVGDGNFHIIPLMELSKPEERAKIPVVLREVTDLILEYEGSLSGEHNDGLIRGPFLEQMYGKEMLKLLRKVKTTFDPNDIFNPHKKAFATLEYSNKHVRKKF